MGGRRLLAEGLVRPDLVERLTEDVEPALLCTQVLGRGSGGAFAQGTMHSFVTAVLLRLAGLNELGNDPELDPGDGQLGEAAEGTGGERVAVVAANPVG